MKNTSRNRSLLAAGTGALCGLASAVVFTIVHNLLISSVTSMLGPMLLAGAICGASISWSFELLYATPTPGKWLGYNLIYVAMFMLLGTLSVLVFQPVTTMAALIAANEPPGELIARGLPLTIGFAIFFSVAIAYNLGTKPSHYGVLLLTCLLLVTLLGLNVSIIGFVDIPTSGFILIVEFFLLIIMLDAVFAASYLWIARSRFRQRED